MRIVKANQAGIVKAVAVLKAGGVVAYPTDTAYGLGGIFNLAEVQTRILKIKKRTDRKFVLVAYNFYQVEKFFELNPLAKKLAKKYWPGPLSIVVDKNFSIRVSANAVARRLCRLTGAPLISTSANISGQPSAYSIQEIKKQFRNQRYQPDLIIDAGTLKKTLPSTVVKVTKNKIQIVRQGGLSILD